jgi:hypothetical protein
MRRHRVVMVLAGAAAVCCAAPLAVTAAPAASAVAPAGTWGTAIEVPGLAQLNQGGNAEVKSVSCGAADNCTAGGFYSDGAFHAHAFLVRERAGTWRKAIEVPGLGILSAGGAAVVGSVSCTSAGNCAAIGGYDDASGRSQNFVVNETNGIWGNAIQVPGFDVLNKHGSVSYGFVSCSSAGNCAAAGTYADGSLHWQAFVVSERNGIWGNAIKMPGSATLNVGGKAGISSVSCASAGNCAAGGSYTDGSGHTHAFVVNETSGTWRRAIGSLVFISCRGRVGRVITASADQIDGVQDGGADHRPLRPVLDERHLVDPGYVVVAQQEAKRVAFGQPSAALRKLFDGQPRRTASWERDRAHLAEEQQG